MLLLDVKQSPSSLDRCCISTPHGRSITYLQLAVFSQRTLTANDCSVLSFPFVICARYWWLCYIDFPIASQNVCRETRTSPPHSGVTKQPGNLQPRKQSRARQDGGGGIYTMRKITDDVERVITHSPLQRTAGKHQVKGSSRLGVRYFGHKVELWNLL